MKRLILLLLISGLYNCYKCQNAGWVTLNTGHMLYYGQSRFNVKQNAIYWYNSNTSTLIRSKNRGLTWDSVYVPSDSSKHLYSDIVFVNDSLGYIAGYDGGVFSGFGVRSVVKKTTDYGTTWHDVNTGIEDSCLFSHINFFDADNGIVFGSGKGRTQRFETHNGGASWSYVHDLFPYEINLQSTDGSEFFSNDAFAIGFTNNFRVAVSSDKGSSWATKIHATSAPINALDFLDKNRGVFGVQDSVFFTTDGASTFYSKKRFANNEIAHDLAMIDMQKGFFCGASAIYYSPDGGITWNVSYSDPFIYVGNIVISGMDVFATLIGSTNIIKFNIATLVGLNEARSADNGFYVFPNPGVDKITVQCPEGQTVVALFLFDELGRAVKQVNGTGSRYIVSEDLEPGLYTVQVLTTEQVYRRKILIAR